MEFLLGEKIKCMKSHNLTLKEKQLKYGEMF